MQAQSAVHCQTPLLHCLTSRDALSKYAFHPTPPGPSFSFIILVIYSTPASLAHASPPSLRQQPWRALLLPPNIQLPSYNFRRHCLQLSSFQAPSLLDRHQRVLYPHRSATRQSTCHGADEFLEHENLDPRLGTSPYHPSNPRDGAVVPLSREAQWSVELSTESRDSTL